MGTGAIQVQFRRGSLATMRTFVGAAGEVTADVTSYRTILHDGVTPGGFAQEKANVTITASSVYTSVPTDVFVVLTKAAARTVTLPAIINYPTGQRITIVDGTGTSTVNNISVNVGSTTDRILFGGSFSSSVTLSAASTPSAFNRFLLAASTTPSTSLSFQNVWVNP